MPRLSPHGRTATVLLLAGLLPGCGPDTPPRQRHRIVTTVGMITDIVQQVAGEQAEIIGIIGEGVDPHLYKPTRGDGALLLGADIVFYNGLLLEGKMADKLVQLAVGGKRVHAVTELIDEQYLLEPPEFAGHPDPHVWMDVSAWKKAVEVVAAKLAERDPGHADLYQANAATCLDKLEALDVYALTTIATIPPARRVLITAHDAFNYMGRRYKLEVLGIQGLSTESEAGLERINSLVDLIVQRGVRAVFAESSVSDRNIRALIEGAAARGVTVEIGGKLFSDAMGRPGTYEGTYIGMIDHNVTTITRGLGGQAPPGGMQGALGKH